MQTVQPGHCNLGFRASGLIDAACARWYPASEVASIAEPEPEMVASAQATAPFLDGQRATLWLAGSGGATLRRDSPRSYAELAAAGMDQTEDVIDPESLEHINMDIPRTAWGQ